MLLSQAIRAGSKLYPIQIRSGVYFDKPGECCALGAALVAMGITRQTMVKDYGDDDVPLSDMWSILSESTDCPHTDCNMNPGYTESLFHIIGDHLNDQHGWTREAIADWLETNGY